MATIEIPGGHGWAVPLAAGNAVRLVNTFGSQVVDTWALAHHDTSEYLSVEHTRRMIASLFPKQGDIFHSNRRSKMLCLEKDTAYQHGYGFPQARHLVVLRFKCKLAGH